MVAALALLLPIAAASSAGATDAPPLPFPWIVDITADELDDGRLRLASLAGLVNREAPRVAPLVGWKGFRKWVPYLEESRGLRFSNLSRADFYRSARAAEPQLVQRKIVYSWAEREAVLPTVLTLSGIHQALPVAAEFDDVPELADVTRPWVTAEFLLRLLAELLRTDLALSKKVRG